MGLGDVIARLSVQLGLETAAFEKGANLAEKRMAQSQRKLQAIGKKMSSIGKTMSFAITAPLVAVGAAAFDAAVKSRDAIGQMEATLESMGDGAGRSSAQLQTLAKDLESISAYDDKEILRDVTSNMLTFGDIAEDNFDRANQAAVNLSAKLNQDLKSSTILIGKALNDPVKGLSALSRVGVKLAPEQEELAKKMAAVGDIAGAQGIILAELEKQYEGSAKAVRDAAPGSDTVNAWSDLKEGIGEFLLEAVEKLTPYVNALLNAFNNLSPGMKEVVVVGAALAAALGPVLFIAGSLTKGFALLLPLLPAIGGGAAAAGAGATAGATGFAAFALAAAPVIAIAAAIAAAGYLVYKNWDKIAPVLTEFRDRISEALGPKVSALIDTVKATLTELWNGPLGTMIKTVVGTLAKFQLAYASVLGEGLIRILSAAIDIVSGAFTQIGNIIKLVSSILTGEFAGAWESVKAIVSTAISTILNVIESLAPGATAAMRAMYNGIKTWIADKLGAVWRGALDKIEKVRGAFFDLWDKVTRRSYIPDMVDDIASEMKRLDTVMVGQVTKAVDKTKKKFRELQEDARAMLADLFPEQQALIDRDVDLAKIRANVEAKIFSESTGIKAAYEVVRRWREEVERLNPKVIVTGGFTQADIDKTLRESIENIGDIANDNAKKTEAANVRVVKSFKDMADDTIGALQNMANSIKGGGFLDILGAVIGLGTQLGSIGAFGKSIQTNINRVPAYANGTNFHPGGLALVGERGPELINMNRGASVMTNRDLRSMGGRSRVEIVDTTGLFQFRVDGQIQAAAPAIASGGAQVAQRQMSRRQNRRVG